MNPIDKETMANLLLGIKQIAMEASLTRTPIKQGVRVMADVYNRCLNALKEQGDPLVMELFPTLSPETASVDEAGVAAGLLYRYIRPARSERPNRRDEEDDEDREEDDD